MQSTPTTAPSPTDTPAVVVPTRPPTASSQPAAPVADTEPITLTVWYPEHAPSRGFQPSSAVLQEQFTAFQEVYPRFRVLGVRMKESGRGGVLDYLRTTSRVVPDSLPDLVLLNLDEIAEAAELGILQPLEPPLPDGLLAGLFPFADVAGTYNGERLAVPYEMDARFLAYNRSVVAQVPTTWAEMLASQNTYLLPLGGDDWQNADALLLQYYAAGGTLMASDGQLLLNRAALAEVFDYFRQAVAAGLMPTETLGISTLAESWRLYMEGGASMVEASVRQYLLDRTRLDNTRYAAIPTKDGAPATIVRGWGWCLVTADQQRQQGAIALLSWLMEKENLRTRCAASLFLPVRRDILVEALGDPAAGEFFTALLDHGYSPPSFREYPTLARALQAALRDVLAGHSSPEQAAQEIGAFIEQLNQKRTGAAG